MGLLDGWTVCPRCATELIDGNENARTCPGCGSNYWGNSAPAVQGLLVRNGRVLLGKRRFPPRQGYWDLPGGFLEEGERPEDGLRREFIEETGLTITPVEFLGGVVDPYDHYFVLGLTYVVEGAGEPMPHDDVEELRWFMPEEIPAEMAFPSQNTVLAHWARRVSAG